MKKEKNFLYKLAITNYDQDLIDWCVGIGYDADHVLNAKPRYPILLTRYMPNDINILSTTGDNELKHYFKDYTIIDYKEHPELTKALLAATSEFSELYSDCTYIHYGKVYNVIEHVKTRSRMTYYYSFKVYDYRGNAFEILKDDCRKPTLEEYISHFSCKLSGKEIVSKKIFNTKISKELKESFDRVNELTHEYMKDIISRKNIKDKRNVGSYGKSPIGEVIKNIKVIQKNIDLLIETQSKRVYVRKSPVSIEFEYFETEKSRKELTDNWNQQQKFDRLRTERDRIKAKIDRMVGERSYSSETHSGSYLDWMIKLETLHENRRNIEKKLNKLEPSKAVPFARPPTVFFPFKEFDKARNRLNKIFKDHKGKDIAHLVETAQRLGKGKGTFATSDFDDSYKPDNRESINESIEKLKKFNMKEVKFTCKNKDCDNYNGNKKSNCEKLFPDIYNHSKPVCRDYKETINSVEFKPMRTPTNITSKIFKKDDKPPTLKFTHWNDPQKVINEEFKKISKEILKDHPSTLKEIKFTCKNKDCISYNSKKKSNCGSFHVNIYDQDGSKICDNFDNSDSEREILIETTSCGIIEATIKDSKITSLNLLNPTESHERNYANMDMDGLLSRIVSDKKINLDTDIDLRDEI